MVTAGRNATGSVSIRSAGGSALGGLTRMPRPPKAAASSSSTTRCELAASVRSTVNSIVLRAPAVCTRTLS